MRASAIGPVVVAVADLPLLGPDDARLLAAAVAKARFEAMTVRQTARGLVVGVVEAGAELPLPAGVEVQRVRVAPLSAEDVARALRSEEVLDYLVQRTGGEPRQLLDLLRRPTNSGETLADEPRDLLRALSWSRDAWREEAALALRGTLALETLIQRGLASRLHEHGQALVRAETRDIASAELDPTLARDVVSAHGDGEVLRARCLELRAGLSNGETLTGIISELEGRGAVDGAMRFCEDGLQMANPRELPAWRSRVIDLAEKGADSELGRESVHAVLDAPEEYTPETVLSAVRQLARTGELRAACSGLERCSSWLDHGDLWLEATVELAHLHYLLGEHREADATAEQVVSSHPDSPIAMEARNVRARAAWARGELRKALEHLSGLAEAARERGLTALENSARTNEVLIRAELSEQHDEDATKRLSSVMRASDPVDPRGHAIAEANLAVLDHFAGRFDRAFDRYHHAILLYEAIGEIPLLLQGLVNLGYLLVHLGAWDSARKIVRYAEHWTGMSSPASETALAVLCGVVDADDEAAERFFAQAEDFYAQSSPPLLLHVYLGRARRHLSSGDYLSAAKELAECQPRPGRETALVSALNAALAARAGHRNARRLARRALELAEDVGEPRMILHALITHIEAGCGGSGDLERAVRLEAHLTEQVPRAFREAWSQRAQRRRLEALGLGGASLGRDPRPPARPSWAKDFGIVGESAPMVELLQRVDLLADSKLPVLVRGESGTGKELIGRALHARSHRASGPLVSINCGAIAPGVVHSALFGHIRGAFSGATSDRPGVFRDATGGTLLLDEIAELPGEVQAVLLRVLQESEVVPVGSTQPVPIDVRVVAMTHRDIEGLMEEGEFREDLYFRLRGAELTIPSLRSRKEDLPLLVESILGQIAEDEGRTRRGLTDAAHGLIRRYDWPGNVRELQSVLREACLLHPGAVLDVGAFERVQGEPPRDPESGELMELSTLSRHAYERLRRGDLEMRQLKRHLERECIRIAIRESGGNVTLAARILGMTRSRLSQLLTEHSLREPAP